MNKSGLRGLVSLFLGFSVLSILMNLNQCLPTPTPDDVFGKEDKAVTLSKEEQNKINCFTFRDFHGRKVAGILTHESFGEIDFQKGESICIQQKYFSKGLITLNLVCEGYDSTVVIQTTWSDAYSRVKQPRTLYYNVATIQQ